MLKDKVVVITGGAGLIGKAFVRTIIENNGIAIIADINEELAQSVKEDLSKELSSSKIDCIKLDITSKESLSKAIIYLGNKYGKIDALVMWLINVVWSIPTLLLVIAITLALGKGLWQVYVAVGLTMWVEVARIIRGQVISIKEQAYVTAAKTLGYSKTVHLFSLNL